MLLLSSGSVANDIGMSNLSVADATLYAVLGYAVVFLGLVLLMVVVILVGKFFAGLDRPSKKKAAAPAAEPVQEAPKATAPGSAGELKLHDVEPKTAAMLMAIVADKMGKPLNELRFLSIREVK